MHAVAQYVFVTNSIDNSAYFRIRTQHPHFSSTTFKSTVEEEQGKCEARKSKTHEKCLIWDFPFVIPARHPSLQIPRMEIFYRNGTYMVDVNCRVTPICISPLLLSTSSLSSNFRMILFIETCNDPSGSAKSASRSCPFSTWDTVRTQILRIVQFRHDIRNFKFSDRRFINSTCCA